MGAGPAGLVLSHLLHRAGIESVIVEARSRAYCEGRIRAGVLEAGSVDLLNATGLGERMTREGLVHRGIYLRFGGRSHHLDFTELTGKQIMVYGQHEIVKDVIAARLAAGGTILFESSDVSIERFDTAQPSIRFRDANGEAQRLTCDFIAGCDATVQPPFRGPTMSFFSARALVKKVSQNGEEPAISLIGLASTPGWCMSISTGRYLHASWSGRCAPGEQSAYWAPEVQVFWPLISQWSPLSTALVCSEARSGRPAPGSE